MGCPESEKGSMSDIEASTDLAIWVIFLTLWWINDRH